jgi:hypothetical protein
MDFTKKGAWIGLVAYFVLIAIVAIILIYG